MAAANGLNARSAATQAGFEYCTSEYRELLADSEIDVVMIATRHGLHAEQAVAALEAGKRVFVEKPLCLTEEELDRIVAAWRAAGRPAAMVGFNRRFSPHVAKVRTLFAGRRDPLSIHYRINAGQLPAGSWVNDPVEGGGRILGEVCHFADLSAALVGSQPVHVFAETVGPDGVAATLRYPDGSVAMLQYLSGGHPKVPKERIEIVGAGTVALIDDFQTTSWQGPGGKGSSPPADRTRAIGRSSRRSCGRCERGGGAAELRRMRGQHPGHVPDPGLGGGWSRSSDRRYRFPERSGLGRGGSHLGGGAGRTLPSSSSGPGAHRPRAGAPGSG